MKEAFITLDRIGFHMATHDYVARRIACYLRDRGEDVQADVSGFEKPPIFEGERGGTYRPDVYVVNRDAAYEVETFSSVMNSIPQIKAFYRALGRKRLVVVLCTGTWRGAKMRKRQLLDRGIRCRVLNYRDLPFW